MINGKVIYISADALPDERQRGMPTASDLYVVRVRLESAGVAAIRGFRADAWHAG